MDRSAQVGVGAIRNFFSAWSESHAEQCREVRLPESRYPAEQAATRSLQLDCGAFVDFARAFSAIPRENRTKVNIWRAAGLGTDEVRNTRVLAWLLDRFEDHGQGSSVLESLIDRVNSRCGATGVDASVVRNSSYWTRTESRPLSSLESRVDIEIESDSFLIFVEVKIYAGETGDQLDRYAELIRRKAGQHKPTLVLFLTPNGRRPDNAVLNVVPIFWRDVAAILYEHAAHESFAASAIRQFADHIMTFAAKQNRHSKGVRK
jgi:hypothetical protein